MRIGYLDPSSGVSGDLFLGALIDAGVPLAELQCLIDGLGIEGLALNSRVTRRNGVRAVKVDVTYPHQHVHRHLADILDIIESSPAPKPVKEDATRVFLRLAEVEAAVHGTAAEEVHFHEVGAADAIADVVGSVAGLHWLAVEELQVGPVNVGSGRVTCAHGVLPVPAPATYGLLTGWSCHAAGPARELTTPTGAALITTLGTQVDTVPALHVRAVGIGAGGSDPEGWSNVLRLVVGERLSVTADAAGGPGPSLSATRSESLVPATDGRAL